MVINIGLQKLLTIGSDRSSRGLLDFLHVASAKWKITAAQCLLGSGGGFVSLVASELHRSIPVALQRVDVFAGTLLHPASEECFSH